MMNDSGGRYVVVGDFSPIALSDYAAGPSPFLPTTDTAAWPRALRHDSYAHHLQHFTQEAPNTSLHVERLARWRGRTHAKASRCGERMMEGQMARDRMRANDNETRAGRLTSPARAGESHGVGYFDPSCTFYHIQAWTSPSKPKRKHG